MMRRDKEPSTNLSLVARGQCLFLYVMTTLYGIYYLQLALRAGNEKEEGETADTVGCCSLRVEHINLYPKLDDQEFVVEFDFLGKDSIRYYNKIPVEKRVRVGELWHSLPIVLTLTDGSLNAK